MPSQPHRSAQERRPAREQVSGHLRIGGDRVFYEASGSGPAVVLIHAGIADHRMWAAQVEAFAPTYRVIRFDIRGFGRSDPPSAPFEVAEDVAAVLADQGVERAAVVGCSMGGAVAVQFAVSHPEMTAALVLVASGVWGFRRPPDPRRDEPDAAADAAVRAGDWDLATELALQIWAPLRSDPATDELIRLMARENAEVDAIPEELYRSPEVPTIERLGEITAPTLVVLGQADLDSVAAAGEVLANGIRGAATVVVPDADHLVPTRRPAEFNRIVLDFLARVGA